MAPMPSEANGVPFVDTGVLPVGTGVPLLPKLDVPLVTYTMPNVVVRTSTRISTMPRGTSQRERRCTGWTGGTLGHDADDADAGTPIAGNE